MQNWYNNSNETDETKWAYPDKAMARTVSEADLKKPHSVANTLKGLCHAILSYFDHRQNYL